MVNFFKYKVPTIIAFLLVILFGYFSIFLMNSVFEGYAYDEMLVKVNRSK